MIDFPFQNQQQLNLDWVMSKLKTVLDFLPVDNGGVGDILQRGEKGAEWQRPSAASMDIIGLATKASPANNDYLPIYDRTGEANKKVTINSILSKIAFPVTSVNNMTGAVSLTASDVGALPSSYSPPVTSVNGETGDVSIPAFNPLDVMPIGYIYLSISETDPGNIFGGTWQKIDGGRVLLSSGGSYTNNTRGGSLQHTHGTSALRALITTTANGMQMNRQTTASTWDSNNSMTGTNASGTTGMGYGAALEGSVDESISLPPYLCVNMWIRTA